MIKEKSELEKITPNKKIISVYCMLEKCISAKEKYEDDNLLGKLDFIKSYKGKGTISRSNLQNHCNQLVESNILEKYRKNGIFYYKTNRNEIVNYIIKKLRLNRDYRTGEKIKIEKGEAYRRKGRKVENLIKEIFDSKFFLYAYFSPERLKIFEDSLDEKIFLISLLDASIPYTKRKGSEIIYTKELENVFKLLTHSFYGENFCEYFKKIENFLSEIFVNVKDYANEEGWIKVGVEFKDIDNLPFKKKASLIITSCLKWWENY